MSMAEEDASSALQKARAIRGGHRSVVTRFVREAEEIITTYHHRTFGCFSYCRNRLNVIQQQLEAKIKKLDEIDQDILGCCDAGAISTEIEESDAIITKVISCKLKLDEVLTATSTQTSVSPPTSGSTPTIPMMTSKPRLPKLILPKFSLDPTKWTTFWDSFNSAFNEYPQLTKIDYLYSLLEGSAFRCVKGLPLSEDNYHTAIELLKQRFGKKQTIICAHMDELVKLPNCANERPQGLGYLYDQITVHI